MRRVCNICNRKNGLTVSAKNAELQCLDISCESAAMANERMYAAIGTTGTPARQNSTAHWANTLMVDKNKLCE